MARELHYQSVSNPIQTSRLPASRPALALPYHPFKPAEEQGFMIRILTFLVLLGMGVMVTELFHQFSDSSEPARLLSWNNIAFLFVISALISVTFTKRTLIPLKLPLLCTVAGFVYVNVRFPFLLHLLLNAAVIGWLTRHLALHWLHYCTTALPPTETQDIRHHGGQYITVMALIPLAAALIHAVTGSLLLPILVLLSTALVGLMSALSRGDTPVRTMLHAVRSWLIYDRFDDSLPGTFVSPSGPFRDRLTLTGMALCLTAMTMVAGPLHWLATAEPGTRTSQELVALLSWHSMLDPWAFVLSLESVLFWILTGTAFLTLPVVLTLVIPTLVCLQSLVQSRACHRKGSRAEHWIATVEAVQSSPDQTERDSIFVGRNATDGSPVLVPRAVFREHAHFLGDSGSGKTALGLAPVLNQLITGEDCSVIVIDLKADSRELLSELYTSADKRARLTGRTIPVRHFSNQPGLSTYAFNPLGQPFWSKLDLYTRTDILCGALGLNYGSDYGAGYYSSSNAALLYHGIKRYPDTKTPRELAERVTYASQTPDRQELHPEIRKAGVHVHTVLERLGSFAALNPSLSNGCPQSALDQCIDLTDLFRQPQLLYFHLSATIAPGSSPEIARLVTYLLLAASTQTRRQHQVYLVIDEFQRMVSRNVEYMLQLARSMGVGVILANQSMEDLRTAKTNLIPAIEANCRFRQWFSISTGEDRERLISGSGETVDYLCSESESNGSSGVTTTFQRQESITPRLTVNDVLLASDHPRQSIVRVSRGAGYAQFGGMPFVVESDFHISREEFERRKAMPWPAAVDGAFIPRQADDLPGTSRTAERSGPSVITEVIDPPNPKHTRRRKDKRPQDTNTSQPDATHSSAPPDNDSNRKGVSLFDSFLRRSRNADPTQEAQDS